MFLFKKQKSSFLEFLVSFEFVVNTPLLKVLALTKPYLKHALYEQKSTIVMESLEIRGHHFIKSVIKGGFFFMEQFVISRFLGKIERVSKKLFLSEPEKKTFQSNEWLKVNFSKG